jgi:hypothetical protein
MLTCPQSLRARGGVVLDGCNPDHWKDAYVIANPEYNGTKADQTDMITEAIRRAPTAARAVFIIPKVKRYEDHIARSGGSIVRTFASDTVPFIPDDYWRGEAKIKTVGTISTPMMLGYFTTRRADAANPVDMTTFHARVTAWLDAVNPDGGPKGASTTDLIPQALRVWEPPVRPYHYPDNRYIGAAVDDRHPDTAPVRQALMWPRRLGAAGIFPPNYHTILVERGASPGAARRVVKEAADTLREMTRTLWKQRCSETQRTEKERGVTGRAKRESWKEYEARCHREGKDPGTRPQRLAAATLNARAEARRRRASTRIAETERVTIPDTVYDAAGNPITKYCQECGEAAAPTWRRCREDQCRARLVPRSKLERRGVYDKSRKRRADQPGVWDRRDQRLIKRARREAARAAEDADSDDYDYTEDLGDDPRPNDEQLPDGWLSDPSEAWDSDLDDEGPW